MSKTNFGPRTLALYRDAGYTIGRVEQQIPGMHIKRDLFGIADYLAFGELCVVLVQVTSRSNAGAHKTKIEQIPEAKAWRRFDRHIHLVSWVKKKNRWCPKVEHFNPNGSGVFWDEIWLKKETQ